MSQQSYAVTLSPSQALTDLCTYELPHAQILTEMLVEHQHDHPADEPDRAAVYVTISTLLDKITTQIQAVIPRLDVAETEV